MACTRWKVYLRLRNEKRVIAMYATTVYADRKKTGRESRARKRKEKISLGRDDVFICLCLVYVCRLFVCPNSLIFSAFRFEYEE